MRLSLALALLVASVPAGAQPFDTNFVQTLVVPTTPPNISGVTSMAWAPDASGRLFITGQAGPVWIVKNGVASVFTTLTNVETNSECGVLGIAFDPAFMDNGYVYVFVTRAAPLEQQIVRFTAVGDIGTNETPIITGLDTLGQNHDGGGLGFGPDGMLYWSIGDNGAGVGQGNDFTQSAAKVGRASPVPGAPPPADNPFNDGAGPNFDYIWARGFRNPFKLKFRPSNGNLWVDVTGGNIEQIFVIHKADHAGWPSENVEPGTDFATTSPVVLYWTGSPPARAIASASRSADVVTITTSAAHGFRKGNQVTIAGLAGFNTSQPVPIRSIVSTTVFTFTQADTGTQTGSSGTATLRDFGNAITGGGFYNATQFPAAPTNYRGNYFFGDYGQGNVGRVTFASDDTVEDVQHWARNVSGWIDAATGPDGALWYVSNGGEIRRTVWNWGSSQGIVVSPLHLRIAEGSRGVIGVHPRIQPTQPITLNVAKLDGDADVTLVGTTSFTFDSTNWEQPQFAQVAAAPDADNIDDLAHIMVSGASVGTEVMTVFVTDGVVVPPPPDAGPPADAPFPIDARIGPDAPPVPDGPPGPDAAPRPDAPIQADGGLSGTVSAACGCGVGAGPGGGSSVLALVVLFVLRRRRRRASCN